MLLRLLLSFIIFAPFVLACDCVTLPAKQAKRAADVVFRGTVTSFSKASDGIPTVRFQVSRIWKGKTGETFEMPAIDDNPGCFGFALPLHIGDELIVYAHKLVPKDVEFFPIPCNTMLVKDVKDLAQLGPGKRPSGR